MARLKFKYEELQIGKRVTCQQLFGIQCYMLNFSAWTTGFPHFFPLYFIVFHSPDEFIAIQCQCFVTGGDTRQLKSDPVCLTFKRLGQTK